MIATHAISIRHAKSADRCALFDLALLDSSKELAGPALLVEIDGVVRAALDLDDGRVIADPFTATADAVELLRVRARRLGAAHRSRPRLRSRLAALARGAAAQPSSSRSLRSAR